MVCRETVESLGSSLFCVVSGNEEDLAAEPLEQLCDGLLAVLLADGAEDDVALLAVRAHPVDADRPAVAGPRAVPPERPSVS